MPDFTFIHSSDLHLDSPFKSISHYPSSLKKTLIEAPMTAYKRMVQVAIERNVAFILISGDIFDRESVSLRVQTDFISGLERLSSAGISVFIIHGNHDQKFFNKINKTIKRTPGIYVFGTDFERHELKRELFSVDIYGVSYTNDPSVIDKLKIIDSNVFKIVCYHGEVAKSPSTQGYANQLQSTLLKFSADYWALGHLHDFNVLNEGPHIVYSGTIQGRSFKNSECGEKGCVLVSISKNKVEAITSLRISPVTYQHLIINFIFKEGNELDLLNKLKGLIIEELSKLQVDSATLVLLRVNAKIQTNVKFTASTMLEIEGLLSNEDWILNNNCKGKIVDYNWQFEVLQRSEVSQEILTTVVEVLKRDSFLNDQELQNELIKPMIKMRAITAESKAVVIDQVINKIQEILAS